MWLRQAVLSGRIDLSVRDEDEVISQIKWHPRGWPWVDPLKDMQANVEGVQNGFTTRSRVLSAQGYDLEETLAELSDEEKLIEKYGLKLGTDEKGDALAPEDAEEGTQANPGGESSTAGDPAKKKTKKT
jgi:capsid protein